jgi:hypothetical protein
MVLAFEFVNKSLVIQDRATSGMGVGEIFFHINSVVIQNIFSYFKLSKLNSLLESGD